MSTSCKTCGGTIYRYNRTGYCKSCFNRSPIMLAASRKSSDERVKRFAEWSPADRLAKYRIVRSEDECWGWTGCNNGVGYGILQINKIRKVATHVALEVDGRPRPSEGHVACHTCDNPSCTNPKHLWWGTEKENMMDAAAKGRLGRRRSSVAA